MEDQDQACQFTSNIDTSQAPKASEEKEQEGEEGTPTSTTPPSLTPTSATLIEPPCLLSNGMEVSIHRCSKSMMREVLYVMPHVKDIIKDGDKEVLIIPTIQKSRMDIVRVGTEVEAEKDRCLEQFVEFAEAACRHLRGLGHWADYMDPCSGLPMLGPSVNRPYNEVAGFQHVLKYKIQNAGCCKILLHPRWGSSCYPATMFTTAPGPVMQEYLASVKVKEAIAVAPPPGEGAEVVP